MLSGKNKNSVARERYYSKFGLFEFFVLLGALTNIPNDGKIMSLYRIGFLTVLLFFSIAPAVCAVEETKTLAEDNPEFLQIPSLAVPVIREGRVEKYIFLTVTLEMIDSDAKDVAELYVPRIKDAFFSSLFNYFGSLRPGTPGVNIRSVKARLMHAGKRAIGENKIKAVLIQKAFEQNVSIQATDVKKSQ